MEAADQSELTLQVEQLLLAALQDEGYALSKSSPLVLTVGTEMTESSAEEPLPLELRASKGSMGIHDRRHPHGYLWRALGTACQCGTGAVTASRRIVPALVKVIGRNVGSQSRDSTAAVRPSPP